MQEKADIGIAWDGDADRCFFIDGTGEFIAGDFVTALLAEAFLMKSPGATVIYDVRASYAVKRRCREQINQASTYILIIGHDTWTKTVFVKSEVEVAIEKGCRLIGANINNSCYKDPFCPWFFADKGALFVPFSSRIIAQALKPWIRPPLYNWSRGDWFFYDYTYTRLGYALHGSTASLPSRPIPYA